MDASLRLFEVAAIAPYWWIRPLVAVALIYVFWKSARGQWQALKQPVGRDDSLLVG